MPIHHSNINFRKLIKDLAEMYNYPLPEVILTELVANSLDAKATIIKIYYDKTQQNLAVEDNGSGMDRRQFSQYHDFAAELKTRGSGIGFAGLGAKIAFNCALQVITETWSNSFKGASNWYLNEKGELIWDDSLEINKLKGPGTRVEIYFNGINRSPYEDEKEIERIVMRHFFPLFETGFLDFYENAGIYKKDIKFFVNDSEINKFSVEDFFGMKKVERFDLEHKDKKYGVGVFGITENDFPLGEESIGVGICIFGKVIKYDFLQQFLGDISSKILGFVEVPVLIKHLNTSKTDFIKGKHLHSEFQKYYEPMRQRFRDWLDGAGIKTTEAKRTEDVIKLEQEIKKIIREFSELDDIFSNIQKRQINIQRPNGEVKTQIQTGGEATFPEGEGEKGNGETPYLDTGNDKGKSLIEDSQQGNIKATPISRRKNVGLRISFCEEDKKTDLAWVEGNTIFINLAHKSYQRVSTKPHLKTLHHIFSIAICLDRKLKDDEIIPKDRKFADEFMNKWGG